MNIHAQENQSTNKIGKLEIIILNNVIISYT